MKDIFSGLADTLPRVLQNTHFNISLQGWPAATAVLSVCATVVTVVLIGTEGICLSGRDSG